MKVTEIKIKVLRDTDTKLIALANILLDDMMAIQDIKILRNDGVTFLAMPSRTLKNGTFKDIAHPINREVRGALEALLFYGYQTAFDNGYEKITLRDDQEEINSILDQSPETLTITEAE